MVFARRSAAQVGVGAPVGPAAGAVLQFVAAATSARTVVEVGTGCGTSGIWLLRGMRPDSVLTSVDTDPDSQRMARAAFTRAGLAANRYRLILGRALDVLPRLSESAYDMVFCDADPREYPDYLDAALPLLRTGGVVVFDDACPDAAPPVLAAARPAASRETSPWRQTVDAPPAPDAGLADTIRRDERLVPLFLPVGNGLLAAVKRPGQDAESRPPRRR